jgi:hypothetical protein
MYVCVCVYEPTNTAIPLQCASACTMEWTTSVCVCQTRRYISCNILLERQNLLTFNISDTISSEFCYILNIIHIIIKGTINIYFKTRCFKKLRRGISINIMRIAYIISINFIINVLITLKPTFNAALFVLRGYVFTSEKNRYNVFLTCII